MDPHLRRDLSARANRLRARVTLAGTDPDAGAVAHLRACFESADLVKVRVNTADRAAADAVAEQLARLVPCEVVQRVGFVLTLYRAQGAAAAQPE